MTSAERLDPLNSSIGQRQRLADAFLQRMEEVEHRLNNSQENHRRPTLVAETVLARILARATERGNDPRSMLLTVIDAAVYWVERDRGSYSGKAFTTARNLVAEADEETEGPGPVYGLAFAAVTALAATRMRRFGTLPLWQVPGLIEFEEEVIEE